MQAPDSELAEGGRGSSGRGEARGGGGGAAEAGAEAWCTLHAQTQSWGLYGLSQIRTIPGLLSRVQPQRPLGNSEIPFPQHELFKQ